MKKLKITATGQARSPSAPPVAAPAMPSVSIGISATGRVRPKHRVFTDVEVAISGTGQVRPKEQT